jgi:hypothetical protein
MIAAAIADHLHARPIGSGRWMARCPAHDDRSASLSIREGRDGRALVHCFAGCTVSATLKASGLQLKDLFTGPPPISAQLWEMAAERQKQEQRERGQRNTDRAGRDLVRKLQAVVDALGDRLVRIPDDSVEEAYAIASLFHDTLARLRDAEAAVGR